MATKVCQEMTKLLDSGACVDEHMQDQVVEREGWRDVEGGADRKD